MDEVRSLLREALERINVARAKIMDALDKEPLPTDYRHRLVEALGRLNMVVAMMDEVASKL
jgi:cell fate (sporulation/competence/biofilm development) regulator YmcA (YheA/YmcA/DUF963 family)